MAVRSRASSRSIGGTPIARRRASADSPPAPTTRQARAAVPERPRSRARLAAVPVRRPPPPPSLDLELSDFALSPGGPGPGATIARPDPSALVLPHRRLARTDHPARPERRIPVCVVLATRSCPRPGVAGPATAGIRRRGDGRRPVFGRERRDRARGAHRSASGAAPGAARGFSPEVLSLALGQSRRLHLEHEAMAVSVASPEVADVQLSPRPCSTSSARASGGPPSRCWSGTTGTKSASSPWRWTSIPSAPRSPSSPISRRCG